MLADILAPDLRVVFTGTSVATASAARGHYYSGPGNKFYELLWEANITGDRMLRPWEDKELLSFRVGLTDLVKGRACSSDANLRRDDYDVVSFLSKIEQHSPFAVAFNGLEAGKRVARTLGYLEPKLGLAQWTIGKSEVFVLPSSSGASANPQNFAPKASKADWWKDLGLWLKRSADQPLRIAQVSRTCA